MSRMRPFTNLPRFTILSVLRLKSINPIHIKQQLAQMNPETRVIIVHTTSYVNLRSSSMNVDSLNRTLASIIVRQASNMSLTGAEYMWIMSSLVLCEFEIVKVRLIRASLLAFSATYSSGIEPKMSPYDNPNRRKMEFYTGTLGESLDAFFARAIPFRSSVVQRHDPR